ncbi:MAG: extracellular solute-binding protein [Rhizobiaceae bacterium]|nr:extracellular solute-binding protein [Rhizobiaceae bacterium]
MSLISFGTCRALGLAAGVSLLAVSASQAETVTVWCWDPNFNGATMEEAATRFKASNPDFELNVVLFDRDDLEQKLQAQFAAGVTDGLPDIVLIEDYSAQKFLLSYPDSFEPLGEHIDMSKFAQYKVDISSVDGTAYSLPFDSGVTGWFYRTDILAEAGYSPEDLEDITWDQFFEIGEAVLEKTGHPIIGTQVDSSSATRYMMQSAGSWYFTPEGDANLVGNPVFEASVELYARFLQSPISKRVNGWPEYTGTFLSGEVASVISGVWMTATVKSNPDFAGKWGVAPVPRFGDIEGSVNASNTGGSSWYVLSSAPEKESAIEFLDTVWGGDVDFYQKILVDRGAFGSLLEAREGPAFQASDDFFGGQPVWLNFSQWMSEIPGVNYGIFTYEVQSAIQAQIPALTKGDQPIEEVVKAIDTQVAQLIR